VRTTGENAPEHSPEQAAAPVGTEAAAGVGIVISNLTKTFTRRSGEKVRAVDDISLEVALGEFLVLLGPSGCGKTTLLRLLAGLEHPESGSIAIGGTVVYDRSAGISVAPENRPASMVFQSYALWPHMTAFENVAYPLRSRRVGKDEVHRRVTEVLEMVGVERLAAQLPSQMSGGQQQRIALARAVVAGEDAVLFDEPLSNVDAKVRDHLRLEMLRMQRELGFTAVYVTHDQEEAMTLGTRIAVLQEGRIAQLGSPREVYERPASRYVANFVGAADELPGRVVERGGDLVVVETGVGRLAVATANAPDASEVVVVVRPEAWRIDASDRAENQLPAVVEASVFLGGARTEYLARAGDTRLRVWDREGAELASGTAISVSVDPERLLVYPAT
jgi:iron(III) transport system ATP-binding protein